MLVIIFVREIEVSIFREIEVSQIRCKVTIFFGHVQIKNYFLCATTKS